MNMNLNIKWTHSCSVSPLFFLLSFLPSSLRLKVTCIFHVSFVYHLYLGHYLFWFVTNMGSGSVLMIPDVSPRIQPAFTHSLIWHFSLLVCSRTRRQPRTEPPTCLQSAVLQLVLSGRRSTNSCCQTVGGQTPPGRTDKGTFTLFVGALNPRWLWDPDRIWHLDSGFCSYTFFLTAGPQ